MSYDQVYTHQSTLHSQALRLTKNVQDAEDLVQIALTKAWTSWDKFEQGTNLGGWLYVILLNTFNSSWRLKSNHRHHEDIFENPDLLSSTASVVIEDNLEHTPLYDALQSLPEKYRTVLYLHYIKDLTYDTISEILGIPAATVRSRTSRGRERLRKLLEETINV